MNTHPQSNEPNVGHETELQKKTICKRLQTSIPTRNKFEYWTHLFEGRQLKLIVNTLKFVCLFKYYQIQLLVPDP